MNTALAMAAVLASWIVVFSLQVGLGYLVVPRLRQASLGSSVFNAFWVGWVAIVAFLQIFQLIFPVDLAAMVLLALAGAVGLALALRHAGAALSGHPWRRVTWREALVVVLGLVAALWFLNEAIAPAAVYDSGLYHLQMLHWLEQFRLVPGLGNLHDRFAFNSSTLLYDAVLGVRPWRFGGGHIANSLLLTVLTFDLLLRARPLLRGRPAIGAVTASLLMVPVVIRGQQHMELSSPSLDLPAFVVVAAALPRIVDWGTTHGWGPRDGGLSGEGAGDRIAALALFSLAPTLRLQMLPLALIAVAFLVFTSPGSLRRRALVLGVPAALLLPWMARGVVLSGYPFYPSTVVSLPVSWRVPHSSAAATADAVRGWARHFGPQAAAASHGWHWLGWWWGYNRNIADLKWPLLAVLVAAVLFVVGIVTRRLRPQWEVRKPDPGVWVMAIGCVIALVVWFVAAPDLRFAWGAIWGTAALAVVIAVRLLPIRLDRPAAYAVIALTVLLAGREVINVFRTFHPAHGSAATSSHVQPDPVGVTATVGVGGGTIRMPVGGDQCWTARLPCSPEHARGLRFRTPGHLQDGFAAG